MKLVKIKYGISCYTTGDDDENYHAILNWNSKELKMVYCHLKGVSFKGVNVNEEITFEQFVDMNFQKFIENNRKTNWFKKLLLKERIKKYV